MELLVDHGGSCSTMANGVNIGFLADPRPLGLKAATITPWNLRMCACHGLIIGLDVERSSLHEGSSGPSEAAARPRKFASPERRVMSVGLLRAGCPVYPRADQTDQYDTIDMP